MRINEIVGKPVFESVSLPSTLKIVASSIGNPVTAVYAQLNELAQRWSEKHNNMRGFFRLIEPGVESRWFDQQGSELVSHLHHLADQAPSQAAAALRSFLRDVDQMSFRQMASKLTPILIQIARDCNSEHLQRNAQEWRKQEMEYEQDLAEYAKYAESDYKQSPMKKGAGPSMSDTRSTKVDLAAAERRAELARQRSQAEDMVNDILRRLPKGVAGDIRNALAREPNKLYALQRELAARNITI